MNGPRNPMDFPQNVVEREQKYSPQQLKILRIILSRHMTGFPNYGILRLSHVDELDKESEDLVLQKIAEGSFGDFEIHDLLKNIAIPYIQSSEDRTVVEEDWDRLFEYVESNKDLCDFIDYVNHGYILSHKEDEIYGAKGRGKVPISEEEQRSIDNETLSSEPHDLNLFLEIFPDPYDLASFWLSAYLSNFSDSDVENKPNREEIIKGLKKLYLKRWEYTESILGLFEIAGSKYPIQESGGGLN